jgi:hypothetical protein
MNPTRHWVLSDCVSKALARDHTLACAENLHDITCGDCRLQIDALTEKWLERHIEVLQLELYELRTMVNLQRAEAAKFRTLISRLKKTAYAPARVPGEVCPACSKGLLEEKYNRTDGRPFLGCSTFPVCDFVP